MNSQFVSALAVLVLIASGAAQGRNVALLGTFSPNDSFNDVWGWVQPGTGREFAVLCSNRGAYVVEATDPTNVVQRGYFPASLSGWSNSTWRDARTYGNYVYVVTEGGGGMQIIDLSDPDNPSFVRTHRLSGRSWNGTHNISIDVGAGVCYAVGTSGGVHVMDLASNPTDPPYLTSYTAEYIHDMQAQDGWAYLAGINRGRLQIVDVSSLPAMRPAGFTSVAFCHTAWPTRDGTHCVATSEDFGGGLTIVDVTNKNSPTTVTRWRTANGSTASVHNAYLRDRVVHASWYTEGYRAVDLSDPANPVEVGHYDDTQSMTLYGGYWGCYPFQPSGVVYASDRNTGLKVLRPKAVATSFGVSTPGSGGREAELHTFGAAFLGNGSFALEVEDAPAAAPATFLVGLGRLNLSFGGVTLLVDTTIGATLDATTDASGAAHVTVPVPNDPGLVGTVLHAQAVVRDPGGPLGLAATAGRTFELFVR